MTTHNVRGVARCFLGDSARNMTRKVGGGEAFGVRLSRRPVVPQPR